MPITNPSGRYPERSKVKNSRPLRSLIKGSPSPKVQSNPSVASTAVPTALNSTDLCDQPPVFSDRRTPMTPAAPRALGFVAQMGERIVAGFVEP